MARTAGKVKRNLSEVCVRWILCKTFELLLLTEQETNIPRSFSFSVTHVLSNADSDWPGLRGRIRKELVEQFLPVEANSQENLLVCACGPTPFSKEAIRYTKNERLMNYTVSLPYLLPSRRQPSIDIPRLTDHASPVPIPPAGEG